jgi:serine/threonine protein kinase
MGIVYLARDSTLDREVALKTLPGLRRNAVRRLKDEARAMAALNHESLATLYGLEMWRGTPVLVVEYFPQGTLARRLSEGSLSPADTVALGIRMARALVYMHARGVLHRDLKPSNIAFNAAGAPKLLDFGLATLVSPSTNVDDEPFGRVGMIPERFVGTPAYVPPEAYRGAPSSPAVDLWALSVIMLEAVTGVNPFSTMHREARLRGAAAIDIPDIAWRSLDCVPSLRAFLERALAPWPALRFQTSPEFQAALESVADALAVRITD